MTGYRNREAVSGFAKLARRTPARLGVGRAGPRYTTASLLDLEADHARAVDAVMSEIAAGWPRRNGLVELHSRAARREEYLIEPERGRRLSRESAATLKAMKSRAAARGRGIAKPSVVLIVGDGLSAQAVKAHAAGLVQSIAERLRGTCRLWPLLFVRNARVRIQDHIGEILRPDVACMLIGERPGLKTADSLSAYVIYRPRLRSLEPDRTLISNIHHGGLNPKAAARAISKLIIDAVRCSATGAALARQIAGASGAGAQSGAWSG